ncbi:MAG TPA: alpha-(1-_3)-arabinofuranosyltransferase family protein [Nocardioides sp.]|uniref:alpha-(1->3)-arabinofuranosyltransferase domain-containing protein n=1 Tax=Nocardioides sp. TaxID=35761 RepID=UPI002E32FE20|nr:alpha-(1->3)-arabinofuranosyltransferase family protein [Nocardioides sp.]HEX5090303.1 alpha-(1->3)-arabinofuranosyltransferase family protein [Nocardioides sp.]
MTQEQTRERALDAPEEPRRERTQAPPEPPRRVLPTTALRQAGYAVILAALAFSQSAGQMVADTKFDLVTAPRRFLGTALRLWDPDAAFGQLQNQAYGYAWPMGPFFVIGELVRLPPWVVQRLWWTLLLCAAFFGVLRLARRLDLGTPTTQVLAAFAFVLTPRITTLLGGTSVEIWPMALAPWVLLPLVHAAEKGSLRRAAALSALVVATCGGVNAIAVVAVLPLGVVFILTRAPGPRRWRLLGWWTLFTMLATAWWWLPLLLLGRYSVPFLDYIENATITTVPTDLAHTLVGESDWVAYFAGIDYQAGLQLVSTPFLMLDAAVVVALGLLGIALRDNPHRRFLTLSVLTGLVLVGFGYAGDLAGFFAADRQDVLDGVLAPLRNLHKFDVVLRIPLVLGLAHAMAVLPRLLRSPDSPGGTRAAILAVRAMAVLALVALALPWARDEIAPRQGVEAVPAYWYKVADYLHDTDDGTVALEVPASAFGVYTWGNTHDDVLQGLADSPWAVRNVIPLAQPGNVDFLDAVTRTIESGEPSRTLASYLAANGVGKLVVRNDLDRFQTGAPDPAYVRSVLSQSDGIDLARSFGPKVGSKPYQLNGADQVRVVTGNGMSTVVGSVDVYTVTGSAGATLVTDPKVTVGDPGAGLSSAQRLLRATDSVLAGDATGEEQSQVLTDGTRRRETNFAAVRWNESATLGRGDPYRLFGPEHFHRFDPDQEQRETTSAWTGDVTSVLASTSQGYADGRVPLEIGSHPGAALDGDPATAWRSNPLLDPTGQYWQVTFSRPTDLTYVTVGMPADGSPVDKLSLQAGDRRVVEAAPRPGSSRTYAVDAAGVTSLKIVAAGRDPGLPGTFGISEVRMSGVDAQRYLDLPLPDPDIPVDAITMTRDPDRSACVLVENALPCDDLVASPGEDGDTLARRFSVPFPDTYRISGTVSLRRTTDGSGLLRAPAGAFSDGSRPVDVAEGPIAARDGDLVTTWRAQEGERLTVRLHGERPVSELQVEVNPAAAVSRPTVVRLRSGSRSVDLSLDDEGRAELPRPWTLSTFSLQVLRVDPAYSVQGRTFVPLDPGISDIKLDGRSLKPHPAHFRVFPCGSGPDLQIGDQVVQTSFRASTLSLLRGRSVPLEACGSDEIALGVSATDVLAKPTSLFRVDTLSLVRVSAQPSTATALQVRHDGSGTPVDVTLPRRSGPSILVLPQNYNEGWVATTGTQRLTPQRVDGWKQGWIVPGGDAVTVHFDYQPETTFRIALAAGAVGLLLCVAAALLRPRRSVRERRDLPALVPGVPGLLDVVVVVVAGGLLAGWYGVGALGAGLVAGRVFRRLDLWGGLSAAAMLLVGAGLTWDRITEASWANEWRQAWSLVAVACLTAALGTALPSGLRGLLPWGRRGRPQRAAVTPGSSSSPR